MILIGSASGQPGEAVLGHFPARGADGYLAGLSLNSDKTKPCSDQAIDPSGADFVVPDAPIPACAGNYQCLSIFCMSQERVVRTRRMVNAATAADEERIAQTGPAITDSTTSGLRDLKPGHLGTGDHIRALGKSFGTSLANPHSGHFRPRSFKQREDKAVLPGAESRPMAASNGSLSNRQPQVHGVIKCPGSRKQEFATSAGNDSYRGTG